MKMDALIVHIMINLLASLAREMDGKTRTIKLLDEKYFVTKESCGDHRLSVLVKKRWINLCGRYATSGPKIYFNYAKEELEMIIEFMKSARDLVPPSKLPSRVSAAKSRIDLNPAQDGLIMFPCLYNFNSVVVGLPGWNWCGCTGQFASVSTCSPHCKACLGRPWWSNIQVEHARQDGGEEFFIVDMQGWDD